MKALARNTDPQSSHDAAEIALDSLTEKHKAIRSVIKKNPHSTAGEIAWYIKLSTDLPLSIKKAIDYHEVMRRLNECAHKGEPRKCTIRKSGIMVCTWYV